MSNFYTDQAAGPVTIHPDEPNRSDDSSVAPRPEYVQDPRAEYLYDDRKDAAPAEKARQADIAAGDRDSAARNANLREMGYTDYARDAQTREDYDHMERQHKGGM